MQVEDVARVLKDLGHPHRLRIFKRLVKSGFDGLPVGVLREDLDIPHSSMTHHVACLINAGLIEQKRAGSCVVSPIMAACGISSPFFRANVALIRRPASRTRISDQNRPANSA